MKYFLLFIALYKETSWFGVFSFYYTIFRKRSESFWCSSLVAFLIQSAQFSLTKNQFCQSCFNCGIEVPNDAGSVLMLFNSFRNPGCVIAKIARIKEMKSSSTL